MKILRNYLLKDFFSVFMFSFLALSLVMLMGNIAKTASIISKGVNFFDAARIFSLFIPYILGFTIPIAFLLGILLVMGRLISDNEITAIRAAGISIFRILNMFLILGMIVALFLFILNDKVIPEFHYHYRSQIKNVYSKNISALIEPGVFLENFQDYILYVADKNGKKLKNVRIYKVGPKKEISEKIVAKHGEFAVEENTLKVKLENGFRDQYSAKNKEEIYRLGFKIFFMDIPIQEKKKIKVDKKPSDMRLEELNEKIHHLKKVGINPTELKGEFHKRISFSFSVIAFTILGLGVSLKIKHREKSINFVIALFGALFYYLLFILGESLIEHHVITPVIGMWLPNIIVILIGSYFFLKNAHFR